MTASFVAADQGQTNLLHPYLLGSLVFVAAEILLWLACRQWPLLGQEREDEPFPREWTVLLLPVAGGAAYWGWRLGRWGFIENILASIVLIGPGLLFTNIIAARWRTQRLASNVEPNLSAVCDAVMPIVTGLVDVAPALPQPVTLKEPVRTLGVGDLHVLNEWLKSALQSFITSLQASPVDARLDALGQLEYTFARIETEWAEIAWMPQNLQLLMAPLISELSLPKASTLLAGLSRSVEYPLIVRGEPSTPPISPLLFQKDQPHTEMLYGVSRMSQPADVDLSSVTTTIINVAGYAQQILAELLGQLPDPLNKR